MPRKKYNCCVKAINKKRYIIEMFTHFLQIFNILYKTSITRILVMKSDIESTLSIIKLNLLVNLWSVFTFGSTAAVRI
jgi:hypothetical protein